MHRSRSDAQAGQAICRGGHIRGLDEQDVLQSAANVSANVTVVNWDDKPLLYNLKANPHRFLRIMALMSSEREAAGGKAFTLYPLHTHSLHLLFRAVRI